MSGDGQLVPYEERFDLVLDWIYQHLDEPLDLIRLAEVAGFSRRHWHRVFTAAFGESPSALVKRVRIQRAMAMLAHGEPIQRVAAACGYPDVSSFTRAFRAAVGMPPAQYRDRGAHVAFRTARLGGDPERFRVEIGEIEDLRCVEMRHRGSYLTIDRTFHDLILWGKAQGLDPERLPMYGVFLSDPTRTADDDLDSLACLALPDSFRRDFEPLSPDAAVPEGVTIRGGTYATLSYVGAYTDMPDTYAWLLGCWLPHSGRRLEDLPLVEHYVTLPQRVGPSEAVTTLLLPLRSTAAA